MKKFTLLTVMLFVFSVFQITAQNAPITIAPDVQAQPGSNVEVPITVQNFNDIGAISLKLEFDENVLDFVSYSDEASGFDYFDVLSPNPGEVNIGAGSFTGVTIADDEILVKITFLYIGGTSSLTWAQLYCEYADSGFEALEQDPFEDYYVDGSVSEEVMSNGPVTIAPHQLGVPGTTIGVPVTVRQFNNIGSISLTLYFDPSVLVFNSFINVSLFPNLGASSPNPGEVIIGSFSTNPSGEDLADDATLIMLYFDYIGGETDLTWYDDGASCEYAGPDPDFTALNDIPYDDYYKNGSVKSFPTGPQTIAPHKLAIPGTTIAIPITVRQFNNVGSISLTLHYNASILTYQNFNNISGFPGLTVNGLTSGVIKIGGESPTDYLGITIPYDDPLVILYFDYHGGYTDLLWFDDDGSSCEYGDWPDYNYMIDVPQATYYIDGSVDSYKNSPITIFPDESVCLGEEVCIPVTVKDFIDIGAISLTLLYSPTFNISYSHFIDNDVFPGILDVNEPFSGTLTIGGQSQDEALNLDDDHILLTLCFKNFTGGVVNFNWYDDGSSCEYADYPDYDFMIDFPQEDYYINGSLTGLVLPVVTEASLLSSTDKNTWLPVAGDLTAGYELCIDPLVDFYYLDINTLTCSNQLATGFVDNEFYLTGTYPQSFFDYWATQGVVNGATGWQGIMWDIINGNAPMFYISWNGTDYQIIDGLQYQNFGGVNPLRVSGDYPSGVYTYKGTVKDVEGCTSEEFEVKITFNTTSTYAFEFEIPSLICTGSTVVVPVTFKSVIENQCGYDGVRFKFGATGPGDATFGATDSFNNYYEFVNDGFWGPPSGFNLPNVYNATTAWDLTFSESGSYSITFSLIEAPDGNIIAGITQTVNVSVNALPVIACPVSIEVANESGVCGKEIEFTATAIGTPTPVITYELEGSAITSPRYFEVGVHEIIAKAENDCGLVTCSFTITVEDTEAPEFTIIPEDLIVECDGEGNSDELNEWLDNVDANDNCGTVTITYDFTELSDGCGATGSAFVIWTATDAYGNTTTTSATFTIEDTTAPEFTIISQDLTVECDGSGNISDLNDWLVDVAADDVCGTVSITHNFTELSDGCGATGSAFVTWTATDACGNTTTISATFTIEDTTAPEFTIIPQDLTVECDGSGNVSDLNDWLADVAADDVCGTVSITHDFTELSDGCGATGSAFVIWTATDACGNTTTTSATFTIEDTTAPEFTIIPQDLTVECDGSGNVSDLNDWLADVAADDVCGTVSITHDFTELSDGCGATGSAFVIWTATDACGNTTTSSATITIEDTTAPEFTIIPQDLTVECDGSGNVSDLNDWLADVAADDVCGTVSITHDFTELSDGCGATGSAFVIWTATDACGNTTTTSATFTIEDTTAPEFTIIPQDLTVECDGSGNVSDLNDWLADVAADDVCGTVSITHDFTELSDGCGATGSAFVIWTATDACGNTTTTSATFTIEDTEAPTLIDPLITCESLNTTIGNCPIDIFEFDANTIAQDVADLYQDVCGTVSATLVSFDITGDCIPVAEYTFRIEDECGNFIDCNVIYTIERLDFVMPDDEGITVECISDLFVPDPPVVTDYCGVEIEPSDPQIGDIPECEGTVTIVYTYTDCAGFSHDWTHTFNIERSTSPVQIGTVTHTSNIACAVEAIAPHLNINDYSESFDNFMHSGSQYLAGSFNGDEGFVWNYFHSRNEDNYGITEKGLMLRNGRDSRLESDPISDGIGNFSVQMRKAFTGATPRQLELWINNELIASSDIFGAFSGESDEVFDFIVDNINIPGEIIIMIKPSGNSNAQQQITIDNITWTSYELPYVEDICGDKIENWTGPVIGGTYDGCQGTIIYTYKYTDCAGLDFNWVYTYTIERQDFEMPDDNGSTIECADDLFEPVLPEVYDYCGVLIEDITGPELIGEIPECEGTVTLVYTYTDCAGFSNDWKYTFIIERSTAPAQVGTVTKSATIACAAEAIAPHLNIKTYSESFDNFEHSGSAYSDGSFIGDNGVTWNYINARNNWMGDSQPYVIDGKGMILRNSESSIETTLNDGIGDFSVKMRKAYTGGNPRQLELYVNNNLIASSVVFGSGSGADPTVHEFIVENINIAGEVTIKLVSVGTGARQLTIDDISLDSYNLPIIQDICGSKLDWTDVSEISDYDGCTGTITYTYTYKDCADLEYLWSYTYYINDDQPPVLIGEIPEGESDMNLCFDQIPDGPSAAEIMELFEDICGGTVTVTKSIDPEGTDCSWVVTYTYTVADECGNATDVFVIYSGGDTEKPAWDQEMPADDTVSCDNVPEIPEITASDNCYEDVYVSFDETRDDGACAYNYTLTRTWEAEDNCGNRISHVQVITVLDTDAPVLVGTLPTGETGMNLCFDQIPEGPDADEIKAAYTDNCGEVLITKSGEPQGDNSGWSVTYVYEITDECGNAAGPVSITYSGSNQTPPVVPENGSAVVECLAQVTEPEMPEAIAACGGDVTGELYKVEQIPDDLNCEGVVIYTYRFTDDSGMFSDWTFTYTIHRTTAPYQSGDPVSSTATVSCLDDAVWPAQLPVVVDVCGNVLNYTPPVNITTSGYHGGEYCGGGFRKYTFNYYDPCNPKLVFTWVFRYEILPIEGPYLADPLTDCSSLDDVKEGWTLSDIQSFDASILAGMVSSLYEGTCNAITASLINTDITGTECDWSAVFTFNVTNGCNEVTCQVTYTGGGDEVTAWDQIDLPQDETVECDEVPLPAILTVTTSTGSIPVEYSEERTDGSCEYNYTLTRTWSATGICGGTLTHTQVITVQDVTAPELTGILPQGETGMNLCFDQIPEGPDADDIKVLYTDNCGEVTVIKSGTPTGNNCSWSVTYLYDITDECGNAADPVNITYTGGDTEAPVLTGVLPQGETGMNLCFDQIPEGPDADDIKVLYTDNCGEVTVIKSGTPTGNNCSWSVTYVYEITDECGNAADPVNITYTGGDTEAPVLTGVLPQGEIGMNLCFDQIPEGPDADDIKVLYTDNCGEVTVIKSGTPTGNNCIWSVTYVYEITDECGNAADPVNITYTGGDTEAPVLTGVLPQGETGMNLCFADIPEGPDADDIKVLYTDNCGEVTVIKSGTPTGNNCSWSVTYVYEITDECGNAADPVNITYTGGDTEAPVLTGVLPQGETGMNLCFADIPEGPDADDIKVLYTDNCGEVTVVKSGTPTGDNCSWSVTYLYDITDECGNAADPVSITYTGGDTEAPVLTGVLPQGETGMNLCFDQIPEGPGADDIKVLYTDNCGEVTVVKSGTPTGDNCSWSVTYLYDITDECGNAADPVNITYTGGDTEAPVLTGVLPQGETGMNLCFDQIPEGPDADDIKVLYTDNCGEVTVVKSGTPTGDNCSWSVTYLYDITDECGNAADPVSITYTGGDTEAPVLAGTLPQGETGMNLCFDQIPEGPDADDIKVLYTDNCGEVTVVKSGTPTGDNCSWSVTYLYDITDECGNAADPVSITYTGGDTEAPVLAGTLPQGETGMNLCFDQIPEGPDADDIKVLYTDNCGEVTVVKSGTPTGDNCSWSVTYLYDITDECGNATDPVSITYTGGDTEAPVLTGVLPQGETGMNLCFDQIPEGPGADEIKAVFTDNCGEVLVTKSGTPQGNNGGWSVTYVYDIIDECGNAADPVSITYSGSNQIPPVVPDNGSAVVECLAQVTEPEMPEAIAACGGDVTGELHKVEQIPDDLNCEGVVIYTYRFTDDSGMYSDWTFTYTVHRTTAPYQSGDPVSSEKTVSCPDDAIIPSQDQLPVVVDVCGNVLNYELPVEVASVMYEGDDFCAGGNITYNLRYVDPCNESLVYDWSFKYEILAPIPVLKDELVNCSSLDQTGITWTVGYAEQFNPVALEDDVAALYKDMCDNEITATHIRTDKDHQSEQGIVVVWNFYYTFRIDNACGNSVECVVHYNGSEVPTTLTLEGIAVEIDDVMCFGASEVLTVSDVIVKAGGDLTLIAGQSVKLLPGFRVEEGGYLHAYISDTYCANPTPLVIAKDSESTLPEVITEIPEEHSLFRVYPNPTLGTFILDVYNFESELTVEIYNMVGARILSKEVSGFSKYTFDLSNQQNGIYIIRVLKDNKTAVERIIKQ